MKEFEFKSSSEDGERFKIMPLFNM